jgi:uncharacterized protein YndB with AHSA1/START domain
MMSKRPQFPVKSASSASGRRFPQGLLLTVFVCLAGLAVQSARAAEPQVTEGFINASPAEVWRIFTTSEGYKQTGAAQAEVDFRVGGTIRANYDPKGQLGDANTIVNEILAYEPERMLALRIKQAPANLPDRDAVAGTWTVIYLAPAGDMTQVRIVGLGYTDQPQSQALRKFFAEGNRETLARIAKPYWPKCAKCVADEAAAAAEAAAKAAAKH